MRFIEKGRAWFPGRRRDSGPARGLTNSNNPGVFLVGELRSFPAILSFRRKRQVTAMASACPAQPRPMEFAPGGRASPRAVSSGGHPRFLGQDEHDSAPRSVALPRVAQRRGYSRGQKAGVRAALRPGRARLCRAVFPRAVPQFATGFSSDDRGFQNRCALRRRPVRMRLHSRSLGAKPMTTVRFVLPRIRLDNVFCARQRVLRRNAVRSTENIFQAG